MKELFVFFGNKNANKGSAFPAPLSQLLLHHDGVPTTTTPTTTTTTTTTVVLLFISVMVVLRVSFSFNPPFQ